MNKFFLFILIFSLKSIAQVDTLNKYNASKKKHGYWIVYLDSNLVFTKKENLAKYYAYDYYDNGKLLTHIGRRNGKMILEFKNTTDSIILLSGVYTLTCATISKIEKSFETFENGCIKSIELYVTNMKTGISCRKEFIDYTKRHNNIPGSCYFEENFFCDIERNKLKKYYTTKTKNKWRTVRIE